MDRTRTIFIIIIGLGLATAAGTFLFSQQKTEVIGLSGSEKIPFFQDERVQAALRQHGYEVTVQKAGSRQIATDYVLTQYDFVFPAGVPAAAKIEHENSTRNTYTSFFTPMVIATWRPIADLLAAQGIATDQGGFYTVDMDQLMTLIEQETRWQDLPNNDVFAVNKSILLTTTDVRSSKSAAMHLSIASYTGNGDNIVQNSAEAEALLPLMASLFLRQGFRPDSSQEPFEDYLVKGMGHSPMVMIYEAQFIAQAAQQPGSILPDMVLMYPQPTIFTTHTIIPITEAGEQVGLLLDTDPELQNLAVEYGLRNSNLSYFREFVQQHNISLPDSIVNVIEPPSYEVLEGMIQAIERQYEQTGGQ